MMESMELFWGIKIAYTINVWNRPLACLPEVPVPWQEHFILIVLGF